MGGEQGRGREREGRKRGEGERERGKGGKKGSSGGEDPVSQRVRYRMNKEDLIDDVWPS